MTCLVSPSAGEGAVGARTWGPDARTPKRDMTQLMRLGRRGVVWRGAAWRGAAEPVGHRVAFSRRVPRALLAAPAPQPRPLPLATVTNSRGSYDGVLRVREARARLARGRRGAGAAAGPSARTPGARGAGGSSRCTAKTRFSSLMRNKHSWCSPRGWGSGTPARGWRGVRYCR